MCYEVLIETINDIINFKTYLQSSSKAMKKRKTIGKKKEKTTMQKSDILRPKRAFQIK